MKRFEFLQFWFVLVSLMVSGCARTDSTQLAGHQEPAHKPKDFAALVVRLDEIHQHIRDKQRRSGSMAIPVKQEFHDLVGWIEEFASDSDLDETAWRRCKQLKDSMAGRLDGLGTESFETHYVQQFDSWQQDISALTDLSSVSQAAPLTSHELPLTEERTADKLEKQR